MKHIVIRNSALDPKTEATKTTGHHHSHNIELIPKKVLTFLYITPQGDTPSITFVLNRMDKLHFLTTNLNHMIMSCKFSHACGLTRASCHLLYPILDISNLVERKVMCATKPKVINVWEKTPSWRNV